MARGSRTEFTCDGAVHAHARLTHLRHNLRKFYTKPVKIVDRNLDNIGRIE